MSRRPPGFDAGRWGAPPGQGRLAVLAVHGRDQDPGFMREVAERIGHADASSPTSWLAPAAPGRTWYPKRFTDLRTDNEPALSTALSTMEDALAELAAEGFPADQVVLLGFSQGACLLADLLIRSPRRFAAVALLTGGYIGPPGWRPVVPDGIAGTPVLLATSSVDEWVPLVRVEETADVLRLAGAVVDLRVDDDPVHQVNDATAEAVRALLTSCGSPSPS